ncbi:MAG: hypothetical protein IPG39_18825 [Bacteroidetes bacterium]|nr:hypothetical protein [Bacteroidota bacterium]
MNFSIPKEEIFGYIDSCIYFAEKVGYYQFIRGTRLKGQYLDKFNNIPEEKHYSKLMMHAKHSTYHLKHFRTAGPALAGLYEKQMDYNSSLKYSLLAAEIPDKTSFKSTWAHFICG